MAATIFSFPSAEGEVVEAGNIRQRIAPPFQPLASLLAAGEWSHQRSKRGHRHHRPRPARARCRASATPARRTPVNAPGPRPTAMASTNARRRRRPAVVRPTAARVPHCCRGATPKRSRTSPSIHNATGTGFGGGFDGETACAVDAAARRIRRRQDYARSAAAAANRGTRGRSPAGQARIAQHQHAVVGLAADQAPRALFERDHRLRQLFVENGIAAGAADRVEARLEHRIVRRGEGQFVDHDHRERIAPTTSTPAETRACRAARRCPIAEPLQQDMARRPPCTNNGHGLSRSACAGFRNARCEANSRNARPFEALQHRPHGAEHRGNRARMVGGRFGGRSTAPAHSSRTGFAAAGFPASS